MSSEFITANALSLTKKIEKFKFQETKKGRSLKISMEEVLVFGRMMK
jgi:hypothetical protein